MNIQSKKIVIGMALLTCAFYMAPARAENESSQTQKAELDKIQGDDRQVATQLARARAQKSEDEHAYERVRIQIVAMLRNKHMSAAEHSRYVQLQAQKAAIAAKVKSDTAAYTALQAKLRGGMSNLYSERKEHVAKAPRK